MSDSTKLFGADGRALHTSDEDIAKGLVGVGRQMQSQVPKDLEFLIVVARRDGSGIPLYYANMDAPALRKLLWRTREETHKKRRERTLQ
jgi:hypothetical protein